MRLRPKARWKTLLLVAAALLLLAVAVRLALNPIAAHFTQKALDSQPGYRGTFQRVSVSIFALRYRIAGLEIDEAPPKGHPPLLVVEDLSATLSWRDLLHLRLGGEAQVDHAKATWVVESKAQLKAAMEKGEHFADLPHLGRLVLALTPFQLHRVAVRHSELLVIDHVDRDLPRAVPAASSELWVHDVEATFENFGTRLRLIHGEPTTLAARGQVQRSGEFTLFVTADPFASKLNFMGELALKHLALSQLFGVLAGQTGLEAPQGTLDLFASFHCKDGRIDGAVKPLLQHVHFAAVDDTLGKKLTATAANAALGLASDRVPGREGVATVIPISGRVTDPQAQLWPSVLGVLRNAYVSAIEEGFAHVPPPMARAPQSLPQQAQQALSKQGFAKAQPAQAGGK